jgi:hypothetical protein
VRRLFWLGVGVAVGALIVRRITKTAQAFTPAGLADAVAALGESVREFAADVRVAMAEREDEMLEALGVTGEVDDDGYGQPSDGPGRHGR